MKMMVLMCTFGFRTTISKKSNIIRPSEPFASWRQTQFKVKDLFLPADYVHIFVNPLTVLSHVIYNSSKFANIYLELGKQGWTILAFSWAMQHQYNTRPLVLQYNTNTNAILTKSRFNPEKLKDLIIIKNENSLVWKHLVYEI